VQLCEGATTRAADLCDLLFCDMTTKKNLLVQMAGCSHQQQAAAEKALRLGKQVRERHHTIHYTAQHSR
jgi:hypothetical protein